MGKSSVVSQKIHEQARDYFASLQQEICIALEEVDGRGRFKEDAWKHPTGGGGSTRIVQNGMVFEKAGVNFSAVESNLSEELAVRMNVPPQNVCAAGISLVLHPHNPMIPTVHMNLRHIELAGGDAWFGGGIDLTPCYLFEDDVQHFHQTLRQACDRHDPNYYPKYKTWCDEYFYIRHRRETRGVGGIFFDYLRGEPEKTFLFVRDVGESFLPGYIPLVKRRKNQPWNEQQKEWQLIRRGRYAEFNLIYDRGTLFGLETNGRTESILMSLPPSVSWIYDYRPAPGSREEELVKILQHPQDWA